MPTAYVKLIGVDADYDEYPYTASDTIRTLKAAVLKARGERLKDAGAADMRVFFVDTPDDEESALAKTPERIFAKVADIVGDSDAPLFLVTSTRVNIPKPPPEKPKWLENVAARARAEGVRVIPENSIPEPKPEPVLTGNDLSEPLRKLLDLPGIEKMSVGTAVIVETPIPKAAPGQSTRFATFVGEVVTERGLPGDIFVPDVVDTIPEPGVDLAALRGGQDIRNALHRMKTVKLTVNEHMDSDFVWIADGTASSGEEFHGVRWDDVEEYCATHTHCFESTRHSKLLRFFLDLDGYVPNCTRSEFREIDKQLCQRLYSIFAQVGCVMTSSMYGAEVHTIAPHGATRKRIANKLSYRVTFRNVFGSRQAMDDYAVSVVLPRLQAELSDLCIVTQHMDAQKQAILDSGRPYLIVDRWVYSIGDRMRMLGSSKDLVVRPFKMIGDAPFLDTILSYIPDDAVRIVEMGRGPRVSIWDAK